MATPPGQALQRVCPHCSTISVTAEGRCPWCRRSYARRILPWIAALALLQTALTVGAVAFLLTTFGDALESELDDQVEVVQRDFEQEIDGLDGRVRRELRRELDARLPPAVP
ncbi:MAG: hypothetical protein M3417_06840 [Actinomycetota bacterium]|nr:hypothetical protein [Actinomycetota bacterium]